MIIVENLKKIYTKEVVIGPLDIEIPKCGITSLIGPNGAGKSTLLLMIGRLIEMDGGRAVVGNMDVSSSDSKELAKILAILRQENHFITRLTVRQLVSFGRFPISKGRLNEDDEKIISKYIDYLGLKELENRYLDELSGGQRQRAYVAMVLTQDTDYILLDEPLNNLDIKRSVEMMNYLRKVADELKKTIIVVMHDINFAARYSDNICAMKEGRIIKFGKTEDVINGDLLTKIFGTKIDIIKTPRGNVAIF